MSQNAPIVQTTARVRLRPSHAGEAQGETIDLASGAAAAVSARKAAAWVANMTRVVESARHPENSFFWIHRIWPVKNTELRSVSHSPLPKLSVRQSKCPRIATP